MTCVLWAQSTTDQRSRFLSKFFNYVNSTFIAITFNYYLREDYCWLMTQLHEQVAIVQGKWWKKVHCEKQEWSLGLDPSRHGATQKSSCSGHCSSWSGVPSCTLCYGLESWHLFRGAYTLQLGRIVPQRFALYPIGVKVDWLLLFQWGSEGIQDAWAWCGYLS